MIYIVPEEIRITTVLEFYIYDVTKTWLLIAFVCLKQNLKK